MNKYYVGIDIGTSSIKALAFSNDDRIFIRKLYSGDQPSDYLSVTKDIIDELLNKVNGEIACIAFSSQTGTYVVDDKAIIKWNDNIGEEELKEIFVSTSKEEFVSEIQMNHPSLISYPLPRLLYIKRHIANVKTVCQLKDYIIYHLTGNFVTDCYTWRGLYNFQSNGFSTKLLDKFALNFDLPNVTSPDKVVGQYKGIDIVVGLNDFFSALIGIGALEEGTYFDITGTSEHVGFISKSLTDNNISSRYLNNYVSYGVTQSSGTALNYICKLFPNAKTSLDVINKKPPIFLPYLNGERAPIYDGDARGMFFGIKEESKQSELLYSVFEGMSFCLLDILHNSNVKKILVTGGAANIDELNQIKGNLLNADIYTPNETESSAYGAYLIAKYGLDVQTILKEVSYKKIDVIKNEKIHALLLRRFKLYKELYKTNKNNYELFKEI